MHIYKDIDGKEYSSVTTIIHKVLVDPEPLLIWSNIMGFKHKKYEDLMKYSSDYGTLMHLVMEHYMKGEDIPPIDDPLLACKINTTLDNFERFCKKEGLDKSGTLYTEKTLISQSLGYAGTIDWIGKFKDEMVIIDYKTSKVARLPFFIQLSAYDKLLQTEMAVKVDKAFILTLREDHVRSYELSREDLDKYFEIFLLMKDLYNKLNIIKG